MSVDPKLATEVAKVVAKEVYGDVFAPAAREIGAALGDLAHTMRVAGLEFGAISRERVIGIFERAFSQVPLERRLLPPPQILGPVLEGLRYEPEGTPINEMWEALLARSMDSDRIGEAHPAFTQILQRLSSDEARLLLHLSKQHLHYVIKQHETIKLAHLAVIVPDSLLENKSAVHLYVENLREIGLLHFYTSDDVENSGTHLANFVGLSVLGAYFVQACSTTPSSA